MDVNERDVLLFHSEIEKYFTNNKLPIIPFPVLKNNSKNKSLYKSLETVTLFLNKYLLTLCGKCDIITKVKLYRFYTILIGEFIKVQLQTNLSLTLMLSLHETFPSLLLKTFPGYIESGLIMEVLS